MQDSDFEPLRGLAPPAPRPEAKAAALEAALQAFRQPQNSSQGLSSENRLSDAAQSAAMRQHQETAMKKSVFANRLMLSVAMLGTIGLVSYVSLEQWQARVPYRDAAVMQTGTNFQDGSFINDEIALIKPDSQAVPVQTVQKQAEAEPSLVSGLTDGKGNNAPDLKPAAEEVKKELRTEAGQLHEAGAAPPAPSVMIAGRPETLAPEKNIQPKTRELLVSELIERGKDKVAKKPSSIMPGNVADSRLMGGRLDLDNIAPHQGYHDFGRDKFEAIKDNAVMQVAEAPVSTFSIDVDSSSYAFTRRALNEGHLPPKDAVRVEEMINYFDYDYALPESRDAPFKPNVTMMPTPWNAKTMLLHVGIKGYDLPKDKRPQANLVFLIDVSGSMDEPSKLPLAKSALKMLADHLQPADHVAIVTYAGNAGTVLEPTEVKDKAKILQAIDNLGAGGSTAGAEGIRQAYNLAKAHFTKNGINRVILATDGDFNVGITNQDELKGFVERERASGIFLSVLGFGTGNYNDALMQSLAQNGNGVASYIDNLNEARRVLVDQADSALFPIAKDVKIQIEFNPDMVAEYRLIGYENRMLQREDFNNDKIDAGEIGAGHDVTAIYEITPKGSDRKLVDDLRYAPGGVMEVKKTNGAEYAFVKIRYKLPDSDVSKLITRPVTKSDVAGVCPPNAKCDAVLPNENARFAAAVAGFGQLLRGGKYTGAFTYDDVIALANGAKGKDEFGLRSEFINLVRLAKNVPAMPQDR